MKESVTLARVGEAWQLVVNGVDISWDARKVRIEVTAGEPTAEVWVELGGVKDLLFEGDAEVTEVA